MFFPHLATNHKGILNAMATEQAIPVQATFPECRLGRDGGVLELDRVPGFAGRRSTPKAKSSTRWRSQPRPGASRRPIPAPFIQLTVKRPAIAAIRFSGPRDGEFLAADEIRYTVAGAP